MYPKQCMRDTDNIRECHSDLMVLRNFSRMKLGNDLFHPLYHVNDTRRNDGEKEFNSHTYTYILILDHTTAPAIEFRIVILWYNSRRDPISGPSSFNEWIIRFGSRFKSRRMLRSCLDYRPRGGYKGETAITKPSLRRPTRAAIVYDVAGSIGTFDLYRRKRE